MNFRSVLIALSFISASIAYSQTNFDSGLTIGTSGSNLSVLPQNVGLTSNARITAFNGGLLLQSDKELTTLSDYDGGIALKGNPINIVLHTQSDSSNPDRGNFNVWRSSDYATTGASPLFQISSPNQIATFKDVDVVIDNGNLLVSQSPVVTQATMPSYLQGLSGQINLGNGTTTGGGTGNIAIGVNTPTSSGYRSVAINDGLSSGWYSFASGEFVQATGSWSIAMGYNAKASNHYAVAFGRGQATGEHSFAVGGSSAIGQGSTALSWGTSWGSYSVSLGYGTEAKSYGSTTVGLFSLTPFASSVSTWVATDPVFIIGNGTNWGGATSSNAQVTLKNGQTTLINKTWNSSAPLADPDVNNSTDADGEALVVKGHARLKGKIIIEQQQGDISMGIYQ